MNVCILSMQKVPNYGSLLQSYSLKKIIESLGHEVSFIDIEKREKDNDLIKGKCIDFSKETKNIKGIFEKIKKIDKYIINRFKNKFTRRKQRTIFENFLKENLFEAQKGEEFDCCVIGSDEVFNCLNPSEWGFTTQLFGDVKQAQKVITYAASCGFTTLEKTPKEVQTLISDSFKKISAFSVRDENTKIFCESLTDKAINMNLDPVIVGDFSEEISLCEVEKKLPQRYCIVYAYDNRINNETEIEEILNFCKKHKLTPITIGGMQYWCPNHCFLTPFEVLAAFQGAEFVITDTFHGTIFASKYAKRFSVISRESNKNKLLDLGQRLSIEKHFLTNIHQLDKIYSMQKNEETLKRIYEEERLRTLNYLSKNIT